MKCEICAVLEATIVIQEKRPDGTKEHHLCFECARTRGLASINPQAARVLASIMNGNPQNLSVNPAQNGLEAASQDANALRGQRIPLTESTCPHCGTKFLDAKKTSSIGCAGCWAFWGPLLSNRKRTMPYKGKRPAGIGVLEGLKEHLAALDGELKKALDSEDYERAAGVRDKIRQLKSNGNEL